MNILNLALSIVFIVIIIAFVFYFPKIKETFTEQPCDFNKANKLLTHEITNNTMALSLTEIGNKIEKCQNLIKEISAKLPVNIADIRIGEVSQNSNYNNNPQINITQVPAAVNSYNVTSGQAELPSSVWTIDAQLPLGEKGIQGNQGNEGVQGEDGPRGLPGPKGPRGQPGHIPTSQENFAGSYNEPFSLQTS